MQLQIVERPDAYLWASGFFVSKEDEETRKTYFRHARYKGGSSTTVNNSYTPTPGEVQLSQQSADYAARVAPNAYYLNDVARKVLENSLGTVQVDFNRLNREGINQYNSGASGLSSLVGSNRTALDRANQEIGNVSNQVGSLSKEHANRLEGLTDIQKNATSVANGAISRLAGGHLPTEYQNSMQNSISSALKNTMGKTIENLGNRGILNSSVTTRAMNDIEKNAADTVARQYQNNISQVANLRGQELANANALASNLGNIYNTQYEQQNQALGQRGALAQQMFSNTQANNQANAGLYSALMNSAGAPVALSAAAQEAAQQPASNLWNMSLGLNGATSAALAGIAGKGSSSQTTTTSGGGGFLGGLFGGALTGAAGAFGAGLWCFPAHTKVKMADGTEKNIESIEEGEMVMSVKKGEEVPAEVIHTLKDHRDMTYHVCCKQGQVKATLSQPLMKEDGRFALVGNLRIGDKLKGGGAVTGVIESGERPVYDLEVNRSNT